MDRIEQNIIARKARRLGWLTLRPIPASLPLPATPRVVRLDQLPHPLPIGSPADG